MPEEITKSLVNKTIKKIEKKWERHDFIGEILDDEFEENVVERMGEYLTDEEIEILQTATEEGIDEYAWNKATVAVGKGFVNYLAYGYELKKITKPRKRR